MTSPLPKCKTCGGERGQFMMGRFGDCFKDCPDCNGTGLDLPTIRAALRLSDRVAKAQRWYWPDSDTGKFEWAFIKLSDLTESEAGNGYKKTGPWYDGQRAFIDGIKRDKPPILNAEELALWLDGWDEASFYGGFGVGDLWEKQLQATNQ